MRPARAVVVAVVAAAVTLAAVPDRPTVAAPVRPTAPVSSAPVAPAPPPVAAAAPSYPVRSVPGYATYTGWPVRSSPGSGPADYVAYIPTATASTPLYGDWDGDGAATPGYFVNGTWVLFDRMVGYDRPSGGGSVAWRSFAFGRAGDLAVVGDWNGDRRTDIGVFRSGTWFQRDAADAGPHTRSFAYGRAGDRPLAGDWDADGRDTVGIRRSAVFHLREANAGGAGDHQFSFGGTGDVPVVGDWDANGGDTVGVVQNTATWRLSQGHTATGPSTVTVTNGSGYALPYPSPAGPAGNASPTVRPNLAITADAHVRPPAGLGAAMAAGPLREAMLDAQKTMLGVEYGADYAARTTHKYLNVRADSNVQELAIRGPAMSALTVAIGLAMDGYEPAHVGESRTFAVGYVDWLLRSTASQHRSLSPGGWGHTWQSSMWAGFLGLAGWLHWEALAPQTRAYVAHVVAAEADWVASRPVPYWKDRAGNTSTGRAGNSAAEEAAWDAGHLAFAAQMLPGHPRAAAWTRKGTQLGVAAYATRTDTTSTRPVNGIALRDRLGGYNAFDDGTVENHGGIHVDYITVAQYSWWSTIYAALGTGTVPEAFTHNDRLEWTAVSRLSFPSPPYRAPGGTVYRPDGTTYYPAVSDWGTLRYPQWLAFDATTWLVRADVDPATGTIDPTPAATWLDRHTARTRSLQLRHPDGHIYEPGEESYAHAEALNAQLIAMGWAARYADLHLPEVDPSTALIPLPG